MLQDDDGITRPIARYEKDEPREYLGVTQTADTKNDKQLEVIYSHVQQWNDVITKSKLPTILNLQALMNRIHKKIQYPLPATTISEQQLQEVSDLLYTTSLPKCGIIRKFPIRFRTLPIHYFGLGMPDLYLEMQISKLKEFLHHCMTETVMGQQLQYNLEMLQIQAGVQDIILNYAFSKYSCLTYSGWLSHMWEFASKYGYTFRGWNNKLQHQRENDKFIMEEFVKYGYSKQKLLTLNKCRMYLNAITLTDLVNGRGNQITTDSMMGRRNDSRRSTFQWKTMNRPGYNSWLVWSTALRQVFCSTDNGHSLTVALGSWLHTKYCDWDWYFDPKKDVLYRFLERHVIQYTPTTERKTSTRSDCKWYKARNIVKDRMLKDGLERASIEKESKGVRLVSFQGSAPHVNAQQSPNETKIENLQQVVEASDIHLPPLHLHNFMSITTSEMRHLLSSQYRIVADGSYKRKKVRIAQ